MSHQNPFEQACVFCGAVEGEYHRCAGRRRFVARALAAAAAGAAGGTLGALMVIERPGAGFIAAGALLGAILVLGVWQAAFVRPR